MRGQENTGNRSSTEGLAPFPLRVAHRPRACPAGHLKQAYTQSNIEFGTAIPLTSLERQQKDF